MAEQDGFVPYQQRAGYLLKDVPERLMRRLMRQAVKEETSLTNVVGRILAERYEIRFTQSVRPQFFATVHLPSSLSLRLPPLILDAVETEANERQVTMRTVLLDALSKEFKLKAPSPTAVAPGKRPGRPKV